jgi:hypothetical protein
MNHPYHDRQKWQRIAHATQARLKPIQARIIDRSSNLYLKCLLLLFLYGAPDRIRPVFPLAYASKNLA